MSSAGGQAVTDASGSFRLDARVPVAAESVRITAVSGAGGNLLASQSVALPAWSGPVQVGALELAPESTCSPAWLPTFGGEPGVNDFVLALTVYDDGGGPALYVGAVLPPRAECWRPRSPSGMARTGPRSARASAARMPRFEPWRSTTTAEGRCSTPEARSPRPGRSSPRTSRGGTARTGRQSPAASAAPSNASPCSTTAVGRRSTSAAASVLPGAWRPKHRQVGRHELGRHRDEFNRSVYTLAVYDDSSGPALYAGGDFTMADREPANHSPNWNGSSWSALGSGVNDDV